MLIHCDCSCDDYDPADVCSVKDVRARKQHTCCECKRVIERGETYELVKGCWEGCWEVYKTCLGCQRIRQHFCSDGWLFGNLAEQIRECIGFNYVTD